MTNFTESAIKAKAAIDTLDSQEILMAAEEKLRVHFEAFDVAMDKLRSLPECQGVSMEVLNASEALRIAWGDQRITDCIKYLK